MSEAVDEPLEKNSETFLREVAIVREDFRNVPLAHHDHRNAVGETVALVCACFVEGKASQKVIMSLGHYFDIRICQKLFDYQHRSSPGFVPVFSKEIQDFDQDRICRDDLGISN